MDWGNCKDILVFLEQKEGKVVNVSLEALTPGPHPGRSHRR